MNDSQPRRNFMGDDDPSNPQRRVAGERRSGTDTRSEQEKQLIGERRSGADRRADSAPAQAKVSQPTDAQLALFARRLRRALRGEKSRDPFGVARSEYDFAIYPEVLRTVEWIESLAGSSADEIPQAASPGKITLRRAPSRGET
jgi:hypothetical protein